MRMRAPLALAFTVALAPSLWAECRSAETEGPDLGIGVVQCAGGECHRYQLSDGRTVYDLSSEPILRLIDPEGPSAGTLLDGDVLIAIDGLLSTSVRGGMRLGAVEAGRVVRLTIRRGETERVEMVTPVERCHRTRLLVSTISEIEDGTWVEDLIEYPAGEATE